MIRKGNAVVRGCVAFYYISSRTAQSVMHGAIRSLYFWEVAGSGIATDREGRLALSAGIRYNKFKVRI